MGFEPADDQRGEIAINSVGCFTRNSRETRVRLSTERGARGRHLEHVGQRWSWWRRRRLAWPRRKGRRRGWWRGWRSWGCKREAGRRRPRRRRRRKGRRRRRRRWRIGWRRLSLRGGEHLELAYGEVPIAAARTSQAQRHERASRRATTVHQEWPSTHRHRHRTRRASDAKVAVRRPNKHLKRR